MNKSLISAGRSNQGLGSIWPGSSRGVITTVTEWALHPWCPAPPQGAWAQLSRSGAYYNMQALGAGSPAQH